MTSIFDSDMFNYKEKYLKYKNKYIKKKSSLQNQKGGTKTQVLFSYQGAKAPPHLGHFNSANIFIDEIKKKYNPDDYKINFIFMPTCNLSSKLSISFINSQINKSDYVSEEDRSIMLGYYVNRLSQIHPDINISCSSIEYDICKGKYDDVLLNKSYRSATINTLNVIRIQNPDAIIGLGIGIDNGFEISTWSMMNLYIEKPIELEFILMCDRKPSESVNSIDITKDVLEKEILISKKNNQIIEAFVNSNTDTDTDTDTNTDTSNMGKMYFKSNSRLDEAYFDILVKKMTVLDSPDEFSSSQVRNLIKTIYQNESIHTQENTYKEKTIDSWILVNNICGPEITCYIKTNNIFNPK